jgi:lysyl-tRNA synthetase, class II
MPSQDDPAASRGNLAYPNDFSRSHLAAQLVQQHAGADGAELEQRQRRASIAGRLVSKAPFGMASTGLVQDASGRLAIVVSDQATGKAHHAAYGSWQLGDIIGVDGMLCRLPSGELALRAHELRRLVKATRPLPKTGAPGEAATARYVDLLLDDRPGRMAKLRYRLIKGMREFLAGRMYMEVETPILHATSQASAGQFSTHHNALDRELYLRRSAEAHLAQLLIGGIEQVFEINRNFINGDSRAPYEETAMDIYCAYTNDSYMMALLEALLISTRFLAAPFARTTVADAIRKYAERDFSDAELRDPAVLGKFLEKHAVCVAKAESWGALQRKLFDAIAAPRLAEPTFVVDFAADVSPGARGKSIDPQIAEYFELFISGKRIAEGRSVQNDPEHHGPSIAGDHASHDRQHQRALEYGLPPASGVRLSIDSLVLVVSGVPAISDTVLFRVSDEL